MAQKRTVVGLLSKEQIADHNNHITNINDKIIKCNNCKKSMFWKSMSNHDPSHRNSDRNTMNYINFDALTKEWDTENIQCRDFKKRKQKVSLKNSRKKKSKKRKLDDYCKEHKQKNNLL